MGIKAADAIVGALAGAGTRLMFGVPGGGPNLDVVGAAAAAGLRFVLAHGETAAAIMAASYADLTGAPGAVLVTRGPGLASAVNGIAHAALDRLPVIVIAAGHSDWVLPSIVITIGPLLLYLDHLVHIPRYRLAGWALTAGPVILVATMSGKSLAVTTGFAAGAVLLGTAAAGFRDLARLRPARAPSPAALSAKADDHACG